MLLPAASDWTDRDKVSAHQDPTFQNLLEPLLF